MNERTCERSGLAARHRVRDGFPTPGGSFWHLQYVDNQHVLGTDKAEVETKFWDAVRGLREAGLTVHEIEFSESTVTMLGWQIEEKGVLRPTYKRIWRIRIAIRELLSRGRMTGQQLERLIGHMTFVSLCRREALAVLGEVYTFIRRHYLERVPIWKTVRKELMKFDGLCPLIFNNMRIGWSNTIYMLLTRQSGAWVLLGLKSNLVAANKGVNILRGGGSRTPMQKILGGMCWLRMSETLWLMKIVHPQTTLNGITRQLVLRQLIVIGKLLVALNGCEQIACLF